MAPEKSRAEENAIGALFQGVRVLLAAGAYVGFACGAPLIGLCLPVLWLMGPGGLDRRKRCQRFVGLSFRFFHAYMRVVGLIRYSPVLRLPDHPHPRIVVANHPTLVDVTALLSAVPELCCLVKSTIYDNPLFFLIMRFCGHIRVNRADALDGAHVIELAERRLEEGSSVLLFPEGTRSPVGEVGPFHPGAFAVAVHSEVELAKVAIFCDPPVLKRGSPWYLIPPQPVTLELRFLGQEAPVGAESIQTFRDRVRAEFIDEYANESRRDPR